MDKSTMEKTYIKADKLIYGYIVEGGYGSDLANFLKAIKGISKDKRFTDWCDAKLKSLE